MLPHEVLSWNPLTVAGLLAATNSLPTCGTFIYA
jgi:hypothetical protein